MIHRMWYQNRVFRKVNFGVTDLSLGEIEKSRLQQVLDLVLVVGFQQLLSIGQIF